MAKIKCNYCTLLAVLVIICAIVQDCDGITYKVTEEGSPDYLVGNIATDFNLTSFINEGINLRFSFNDPNSPVSSFFTISENTGNLHTVGVLDREKICEVINDCDSLPLEVVVTASKSSFLKKFKFTVIIEDINDHAPTFQTSSVNIEILESMDVGAAVTTPGAEDPDSTRYSIKSYSIITPGTPFTTNVSKRLDGGSSVQIIVAEELDREKTNNYQFQIVAIDGGSPPKSGTLFVNITIIDTNDNYPVFTNTIYNKTVKEDIAVNTTILQVSANDKDIGANGHVAYSIVASQSSDDDDLFTISPQTGEIRTVGRLKYIPGHQYKLIVEARDAGLQPHTAQALVYIAIQDVENNPPKIRLNLLSSANYAKVSELADQGAVVALLAVSDDDIGWNGITNCSIRSEVFALEKSEVDEYSVIVSQSLDRETRDQYNVTVTCQDIGTPPMNSSAVFQVVVLDENDHEPVFSQPSYTAEVLENNNYGDIVASVRATDQDAGKNGLVRYELQGDAWSDFTIESDTGVIHAADRFDRELKEEYIFHVMATDGGEEAHMTIATVTLTVKDENDNKPIFEQAYYEFRVPENQPQGFEVGKVYAEDGDAGNNGLVSYTIAEKYEITVPFKLLPDGTLVTKKGLDRELQSRYDFSIIAADQGSPQRANSSVNVSVFVTDVNDNSPFILSPEKPGYVIYVSLSTPVNTPLYLVKAHDIDEDQNAKLTYQIEERNDTQIFDINDSGQILVARPIESWEVNIYMVQVAVYDNGTPRNFAKRMLIMSVTVSNSTGSLRDDEGLQGQNLLIALTVVIVTVVLGATILITIFVIRRMDKKKQEFFGADTNSDRSVDVDVSAGIRPNKDLYSRPNNMVQLGPVVSHLSLDKTSTSKEYIYKPRLDTPTPSSHSQQVDQHDGDVQLHQPQSQTQQHTQLQPGHERDTSTPRLNRLASLRLQQALLQSHDKPWTNHNDSQPSPEAYGGGQRTAVAGGEDSHSQMSGDGDSGRGGSVSDAHSNMGNSHDADDPRILQLQSLVRQSGRQGTPPHRRDAPVKSPSIDNYQQQQQQQHKHPHPHPHKSNLTPRDHNTSQSSVQLDQSNDSRNLKACYSNSDLRYPDKVEHIAIPRYPSHHEKNSNNMRSDSNSNSNCPAVPPRSKPSIQMGLSSFSSNQFHPNVHREQSFNKNQSPRRQLSDGKDTYYPRPEYSEYSPEKHPHKMPAHHKDRVLDETMDSIATTAYDDDDNTTTSGSYTIDNYNPEDFVELNVAQLKDMFV